MLKSLKLRLLNLILKRVFNSVNEEDVFRIVGSKAFVGRNEMSQSDQQQILMDARFIKESVYWKLLLDDMRFSANDRIFNKSTSMDDVVFGKAVLWCLDVMDSKLSNLSKMK